MKLGVMSPVLNEMGLEDALKYLSSLGVDSLEIGAGGYPGKAHLDPKDYLNNPAKVEELKGLLKKYNIEISAVSCHGNPVHPNKEIAEKFHNEFVDAMKIAGDARCGYHHRLLRLPGRLRGIEKPELGHLRLAARIIQEILEWQWNEVLIPYWKETAKLAKEIGIKRNRVRAAPRLLCIQPVQPACGCGKPSAISSAQTSTRATCSGRELTRARQFVRSRVQFITSMRRTQKLTRSIPQRTAFWISDSYGDIQDRSWVFRTVGYGHGQQRLERYDQHAESNGL